MLSVDEYRDKVLATVGTLAPIELPLASAHGCVVAADVVAPWPLPSFDNSSMDGYAVRADDLRDASADSPVELSVIDDVPAGFRSTEVVEPGVAIRIMTGAPLPAGADAVVAVEQTDGGTETVQVFAAVAVGASIRRAGTDVVEGQVVLEGGTLIGARQIGILAAVGAGLVFVHPRPRIAVLSTGSELVEPGLDLRHGLVSDSNSYQLVAAAKEAGADAYRIGPLPDDEAKLLDAIEDQLHRADLILTSGGVSMGAYDTVKSVLGELGTVEFCKVAMNPGMPQGVGVVGDTKTPIITLPGNPVSSYVSFEVFVRPAIRQMRAMKGVSRREVRATCAADIASPAGKRQFVRARFVRDGVVLPTGPGQGSHMLGGLAHSNALIVVPEDVALVSAGETVDVIDLRRD